MLTEKQYQVYQFIQSYIMRHHYAPTTAEIAEGIGIKSRGVVHRYITALRDAGYLRILRHKKRNIELISKSKNTEIPILGAIPAGQPIEAIEDRESFDLLDHVVKDGRFLLRVKGDSMIGDNICDNDLVICQSCNMAENNAIVVALIHQQDTTLKRYQVNPADNTITLIPSNPAWSPQTYCASEVEIQGRYIGLLRFD